MLRNISIKASLAFLGGFAVFAVIVLAGLLAFSLYESNTELKRQVLIGKALETELAMDAAHESIKAIETVSAMTGPSDGQAAVDAVTSQLNDALKQFADTFAALRAMDLPPEVHAALEDIAPDIPGFAEVAKTTAAKAMSTDEASITLIQDFNASFDKLEPKIDRIGSALQDANDATEIANAALSRLIAIAGAVISLLMAVTMGFVAWRIARNITQPILALRSTLAEVAQGNFALRTTDGTRDDEIGAIARDIDAVSDRVIAMMDEQSARQHEADQVISSLGAEMRSLASGNLTAHIATPFKGAYDSLRQDFNQTAQTLSQSIRQVVEVSTTIRAQSSDLSRAAENLSTRTENQAATLEETAAALEEVTSGMTSAADNAREVEDVVQRARSEVEQSGTIVLSAVTAMHEIEASSSQISQIIGVIDDIAFQTNLLALNAGVEAARAGDAGRGFAVVASEVRALAQRSSTAAKEIKGLIGSSAQQVERGVQQVDQARLALGAVVTQVARISDLVSHIARGSGDQARALHEINLGVAQLDQVTQQNAAMAEESGAASRAVEEEAIELDKIVSRFALGGARSAPRPARSTPETGSGWIAA